MLRRRPDVDYHTYSALFVARPACPPELMQEQLDILGCEIIARYQGAHDVSSLEPAQRAGKVRWQSLSPERGGDH